MRFTVFAVLAVLVAASRRAARQYARRYRYTSRRRPPVVARYRRGVRVEDPTGALDRQWSEAIKAMAARRRAVA